MPVTIGGAVARSSGRMPLQRFLSEYLHLDGTKWAGPDFYADDAVEAEALAAGYPCQPLRIVGEHVETFPMGPDDVVRRVLPVQRLRLN